MVAIATRLIAGCGGTTPVAVVENASTESVTVRLETDIGESYPVESVAPGNKTEVKLTGRDKSLWVVAEFPGGRVLRSRQLYTTTRGRVSVRVTNNAVELVYAL